MNEICQFYISKCYPLFYLSTSVNIHNIVEWIWLQIITSYQNWKSYVTVLEIDWSDQWLPSTQCHTIFSSHSKSFRMYQGFWHNLGKSKYHDYFWSILTTFKASSIIWGCWGSSKNKLKSKIKPLNQVKLF